MAENKTQANKASVSAYIEAIGDETRRKDAKALVKLMQRISGEKPVMWGTAIVGFGSYHYKYDSGREGDMPRIGFSSRKEALVLYLMLGLMDETALDGLGKFKTGKGCLYIKKLTDVDLGALEKLIARAHAEIEKKCGGAHA